MKKVTLTISSTAVTIKPINEVFEAETFPKAVGLAMKYAHENLTDQYVDPIVIMNGLSLADKVVLRLKGGKAKKDVMSYIAFQCDFEKLRSELITFFAFQSQQSMVDFVRSTDVNGHYDSVKDSAITPEITAYQAKAVLRKVKAKITYVKADAELSVMTAEDYQMEQVGKGKVKQLNDLKIKLGLKPAPQKQIAAPKPGKRIKK